MWPLRLRPGFHVRGLLCCLSPGLPLPRLASVRFSFAGERNPRKLRSALTGRCEPGSAMTRRGCAGMVGAPLWNSEEPGAGQLDGGRGAERAWSGSRGLDRGRRGRSNHARRCGLCHSPAPETKLSPPHTIPCALAAPRSHESCGTKGPWHLPRGPKPRPPLSDVQRRQTGAPPLRRPYHYVPTGTRYLPEPYLARNRNTNGRALAQTPTKK